MRIDIAIATLVLFGGLTAYSAEVRGGVRSSNDPVSFLCYAVLEPQSKQSTQQLVSAPGSNPIEGTPPQFIPRAPFFGIQDETGILLKTVDLGSVMADGPGGESSQTTILLGNYGDSPLTIRDVQVVGGQNRAVKFSPQIVPGMKIGARQTVPVTVTFDPSIGGAESFTLRFLTDGRRSQLDLSIHAMGVAPVGDIQVSSNNTNLGGLALGATPKRVDQVATIKNMGAQPLEIYDIRVVEGADQFAVGGLPRAITRLNPLILQPDETQTIGVLFDAAKLGIQRGIIQIYTNDPETSIQTLTVIGTGLPDGVRPSQAGKLGRDYIAVQKDDGSGSVQRMVSDADGKWEVQVEPNTLYRVVVFDPESGLVASELLDSDTQGKLTSKTFGAGFRASTAPDKNNNGMPDDIDFAMGNATPRPATSSSSAADSSSVPRTVFAFPSSVAAHRLHLRFEPTVQN